MICQQDRNMTNPKDAFMYLMTTKWSPCAHLVQNANFRAKCISCGVDHSFQDWIFQKDNLHGHLVQNVNLKVKCTFVEFMTQFKTKSTRKTQSCQIATIDLQLHSHLVQNTHLESFKTPWTSKSLERKKYAELQDLPCKDAVAKQDHNLEWHKHHNATPTYCKLQNDKLNGQLKS